MKYHPRKISSDLLDMAIKLSAFSLNNVEWGCLYSGAGIINILGEKDIQRLYSICSKENVKEITKDVAPLKCIYKKAKAAFSKPPSEILNPGKYMWDFTSFNKEILPQSQALGILNLCRAAEAAADSNLSLGIIMKKTAEAFYDFTTTYLRNEDGLFVSAENKTKFINDELVIKQNKGEPKLIDQVIIHEAFLSLYALTSNQDMKYYYTPSLGGYLNDANNIFKYLFTNYNLMLESSSKDISQFISSFARCCSSQSDPIKKVNYQHIIALLCAELESRIKVTGEVEKNYGDLEPASLITHFRTASALLEGYAETGIEKFRDMADKIYNLIEDFFDYSMKLFIQGDYNKISYSARDIAEVLKCLYMFHVVNNDERSLNLFTSFFDSAVEKSGIVQSAPHRNIQMFGLDSTISESIPLMSENSRAPVFLRSFRINIKKSSTLTVSKHFSSAHSLYLSFTLLHYLLPLIKGKTLINNIPKNIQVEMPNNQAPSINI